MDKDESKTKKIVGFFPPFFNLAETGRAVLIAKRYREMGGKAIFFSHGGKFEFLAKKNGFEIIKVKPEATKKQIEDWFKFQNFEKLKIETVSNEKWLLKNVQEEIKAFKKTKISLLVTTNNVTCAVSARAAKIPYINVTASGGNFALKMPDALENPLTFIIPQFLKVRFINFVLARANWYLKSTNKVAEQVNSPTYNNWRDIFHGDLTFVTDNLDFINIFPNQQLYNSDEYVGIILLDELFVDDIPKNESEKIYKQIDKHINKTGKSIMISLGSSGTKDIFIKILKTLEKTQYNVIGIYTSIFDENDLPKFNDNILLIKFVPSIKKVNKMVDLAIIHGGQGTVYNAIYSKKPIIGIPMHMEQQFNLEKIVGHGLGIMLSKKYFNSKKLIKAINKIFTDYEKYKNNAEKLADKLPLPKGEEIIAEKIYRFINK